MPKEDSKRRRRIRIGDLLVENRVISEGQLQQALAEQKKTGRKLGQALIELGFLEEQDLLDFLSRQLQIPFIDLRSYQIDLQTVNLLQEAVARRYRVIALEEREKDVLVGMADPTDLFAYDELGRILGKRVRQAVLRESELLDMLDRVYRRSDELGSIAGELGAELIQSDFDLGMMMQTAEAGDAPVIRMLQTLFEDALQARASDIHIEPDENVLRIRQRIDGVLQEHVINERHIAPALVQRLKLLAHLDISEKRLPQDGRFQIKIDDNSVDVRLSTLPVQYGESVVMRLLDQSSGILSLQDLGIRDKVLQRLRILLHRPHGMVLVTGPTGSGKTTTLYAALSELNSVSKKIITVEDPVEYRLPRINQVQIHEKIGLTFARVLRTALRQDPDIMLIGEMRDLETAQIGLRSAITGHFVLSTLHTNSAIGTVSRLLDMGAQGYLLASSLVAIIAQRLVRRICPHCKRSVEPDQQQRTWLESFVTQGTAERGFYHGAGCNRCGNSGYSGRAGIYELLEMNSRMAAALQHEDQDAFANAARAGEGYEPLTTAGLRLAADGITTLDEVIRISDDSASPMG